MNNTLEEIFYHWGCIAKTNILWLCLPQLLKMRCNKNKKNLNICLNITAIVAFHLKKKYKKYTWIEFKYVVWRISPAFVFVDIISPFEAFKIAVAWIYERGPKRFTGFDAYAAISLKIKQKLLCHIWRSYSKWIEHIALLIELLPLYYECVQ